MSNPNSLRVTLYRLAQAKILHRLQRGLYSLIPPQKLMPEQLAIAYLHRFCYLTTESVLRDAGIIFQSINALTFASSVSRRFAVDKQRIISRKLSDPFLQNLTGLSMQGGILRASPERAIADMLYFDPKYHFDAPIDWKRIRQLQKQIGYPLTPDRYVDPS